MPSFEIADCPTTLPITETTTDGGGRVQRGTLTLTVRNLADRAHGGRLTVETVEGAEPAWFRFEGALPTSPHEIERDFEARGSATIRTEVSVPIGEAPRLCVFRVRVTAEDDPDNDFTSGPNVAFNIAPWTEAPPPPPSRFPWWAVAVAAVLVLVVGGAIAFLLLRSTEPTVPRIIGMPLDEARAVLQREQINHGESPRDVIRVINPPVPSRNGVTPSLVNVVIAVDPLEGADLPEGTKLDVFTQAGIDPFFCRRCDNRRFSDLSSELQAKIEEGIALALARSPPN